MNKLLWLLVSVGMAASGGTIFIRAYPNWVLVFDEGKGEIVNRIRLETGIPTSMRLSMNRKKLYVTTNTNSGVEVIDVATHKVLNHFTLNTPNRRYRFNGGTPDPEDKVLYTISTQVDKLADRCEIGKPKYTVIDLAQQKIVRTADVAGEDENADASAVASGRANFDISIDGKFLYQFRETVEVLDTSTFKVIDRIELAKPELPNMESLGFGNSLDSLSEPGRRVSVFNSADPIVHNRVFGIADFNLQTRKFEFTPIGPAPPGMAGLHVAPDKKNAYTVITSGAQGNKRCEFWSFDLGTNKMTRTAEFPCRSRFSFSLSSDGKKIYLSGAGYQIDVYDAATFKHEKTWDLNADMGGGMIALP